MSAPRQLPAVDPGEDPSRPGAAAATTVGSAAEEEMRLVEALRRGDEGAFMQLVERHHAALLRLAQAYVGNRAVAEEVVQETWLAVLRGLDRFEGRSSLKTWIFRILVNMAKTRAQREGRSVPFSSLGEPDLESDEPAVDPERFRSADDSWPGGWISFPRSWDDLPEQRVLSQETLACVERAMQDLPPSQRTVIRLRDVEGCSAEEACNVLGISESNQRVLLHRARSRVRRALELYLDEEQVAP
jgi:RNA polymerase sigma-70 factor (ECF subfamily)